MNPQREEIGDLEVEVREDGAVNWAATETRAERRARRRADPYVAAKEAIQRPAYEARMALERAQVPTIDRLIAAIEAEFGCDIMEITPEMVANSIFRKPTTAQEAIERERVIAAQFKHNAAVMAPELRELVVATGAKIIEQYREHDAEQALAAKIGEEQE